MALRYVKLGQSKTLYGIACLCWVAESRNLTPFGTSDLPCPCSRESNANPFSPALGSAFRYQMLSPNIVVNLSRAFRSIQQHHLLVASSIHVTPAYRSSCRVSRNTLMGPFTCMLYL